MGGQEERRFIVRTLRSGSVVAGFVAFVLASYGFAAIIGAYLAGFLMSVALLLLMEWFIRAVATPERVRKQGEEKKTKVTMWLSGFALVKYPLVALLLWWLVRVWDAPRLMAFAGGFATLHIVMGLRALGRVLTRKE